MNVYVQTSVFQAVMQQCSSEFSQEPASLLSQDFSDCSDAQGDESLSAEPFNPK